MKVYIKAASKKALNDYIAKNGAAAVSGAEYSLYGATQRRLADCPDGTVVSIFDKYVGGNPYAKAYGVWRPSKNKLV